MIYQLRNDTRGDTFLELIPEKTSDQIVVRHLADHGLAEPFGPRRADSPRWRATVRRPRRRRVGA